MKRALSLILAVLMIVSLFAGCNNGGAASTTAASTTKAAAATTAAPAKTTAAAATTAAPAELASPNADIINMDSALPIVTETVSPTMVIPWRGEQSTPEEMWLFNFFKEKCNLDFEVDAIETTAMEERINLMLNSGDLPDVFLGSNFTASQMKKYFSDEELGFDMNEYVNMYAPHLQEYFELIPEAYAACVVDGKLLSLPYNNAVDGIGKGYSRNWINQKWLNALEMDVPYTIDEFKNTLIAFRDNDPNGNGVADEIPWAGSWEEGYGEYDFLVSGFGASYDFDFSTGKPVRHYWPLSDNFYQVLDFMSGCWAEGLMDLDMFTQNENTWKAKAAEGRVGFASAGAQYVILPTEEGIEKLTDYTYEFMPYLAPDADTQPIGFLDAPVIIGKYVISADSEYADVLVRFADMFFDMEFGQFLRTGPLEGSEYDFMEDHTGAYFWNDEINDWDYNERLKNHSELSSWEYMLNYVAAEIPYVGITTYGGAYIPKAWLDRIDTSTPVGQMMYNSATKPANENAWNYGMTYYGKMTKAYPSLPTMYYSTEDSNRINELYTPIDDTVQEYMAQVVTGAKDLASTYDAFIAEIKALGAEELQDIYVRNYDAYLANMK